MILRRSLVALVANAAVLGGGCEGGSIDAGRNRPHGPLPVDERNPVILANDSVTDNWLGEYAMLLANSGGPPLVGLIVNASAYWPDLQKNAGEWRQLIAAARSSGLDGIPDVTASSGGPLVRPADGVIESTTPNRSEGARLIVEVSSRSSLPGRPVVVVTGGRLTDLADAYLMDPTLAERVVVVSSLGQGVGAGSSMSWPNFDLDPWAAWIVGQRLRYVQVSGYYDHIADVPASMASDLPAHPLGAWMAGKVSTIVQTSVAADQIAILSVALPTFAVDVQRVRLDTAAGFNPDQGTPLMPDVDGPAWLVSSCDGAQAARRLWEMLRSNGN
jgi:hypothetical protein